MTEITMIPLEYIILFAMAIVEVLRKRLPDSFSDLKPFIAFTIAIACNVGNAALFGGNMLLAGKDAFIAAGVALAMFSGGSVIGKILTPKTTADTVNTIVQAATPVVEQVVANIVKTSTPEETTVTAEQSQANIQILAETVGNTTVHWD